MKSLDFTSQAIYIMGVINTTPDSFYPGSRVDSVERALQTARQMLDEGVDILDIGGESTRPGAEAVDLDEECKRVLPVIEAIRQESDIPISIDTMKPELMQLAVDAGATMINDVRALQEPGALEVAALTQVPVCLMHMLGLPRTMQNNPQYDDVVGDIAAFFQERITACTTAGIAPDKIILDPGFGFGKTPEHNLTLIKHLRQFERFSCPILMGVSRKSTIGHILNAEAHDRLAGSLGLAALAMNQGARIIRTHDVKATVDVAKIFEAYQKAP